MKQSQESLLLQEYASTVNRTYPDFIRSMGRNPQAYGIDEQLWAYVEENQPDYDEFMAEYLIFPECIKAMMTQKSWLNG